MNADAAAHSTMPLWYAPTATRAVDGTVHLPGSKSITNRALVLAALTPGPTTVALPLWCRDTELMVEALRALGTPIAVEGDRAVIGMVGSLAGRDTISVGNAGTVARFVPGVAALGNRSTRFDGDDRIRQRPIKPLIEALRRVGATITCGDNGGLPFTVVGSGSVRGGGVWLDGSASSQFVSALLLVGSQFEEGVNIRTAGGTPSGHHIRMTLDMLSAAGVPVVQTAMSWTVPPGRLRAKDLVVEPDLSSAAPFVAAAVVTAGRIHFPGWPSRTTQPGDRLRDLASQMGADCVLDGDGLTVVGPDRVRPLDVDLTDEGELTPVIAALLCFATGPSRLRGISHLRGHESDRLGALAKELSALGPHVVETSDGLTIDPAVIRAGTFETYDDHRLVMAGAVVALGGHSVAVADPSAVRKTYPKFVETWSELLGGAN